MADLVAIRTALTRLGFTAKAANMITNNQCMESLDEFALLTDDEVINLCKVVRRPGGATPNPASGVVGQPTVIRNEGLVVSLRAENNLKLACYFMKYSKRTLRTILANMITLDSVRACKDYKLWEKDHKDVETRS